MSVYFEVDHHFIDHFVGVVPVLLDAACTLSGYNIGVNGCYGFLGCLACAFLLFFFVGDGDLSVAESSTDTNG